MLNSVSGDPFHILTWSPEHKDRGLHSMNQQGLSSHQAVREGNQQQHTPVLTTYLAYFLTYTNNCDNYAKDLTHWL